MKDGLITLNAFQCARKKLYIKHELGEEVILGCNSYNFTAVKIHSL